jgi:hypothetical protein
MRQRKLAEPVVYALNAAGMAKRAKSVGFALVVCESFLYENFGGACPCARPPEKPKTSAAKKTKTPFFINQKFDLK